MAEMTLKMNAFEPLAMDEMMAVDGGRRVTASDVGHVSTTLSAATWTIGALAGSKLACAAGAAILASNPVFVAIATISTVVSIGCYYYNNSRK